MEIWKEGMALEGELRLRKKTARRYILGTVGNLRQPALGNRKEWGEVFSEQN